LTDELELEWQSELEANPDDPQIIRPLKKLYLNKIMLNFLYIALKVNMPIPTISLFSFLYLKLKLFEGAI